MPCCHTYRPQSIEHVRKPCYGSHTITLGGVPRNVPGLPNSSATTEEGNPSGPIRTGHNQHTHTGTLANPSHNSKFLVFIRYPEPQLKGSHSGLQPKECHMINPYPEPQLKDTFQATTHGTPTSPPSRLL